MAESKSLRQRRTLGVATAPTEVKRCAPAMRIVTYPTKFEFATSMTVIGKQHEFDRSILMSNFLMRGTMASVGPDGTLNMRAYMQPDSGTRRATSTFFINDADLVQPRLLAEANGDLVIGNDCAMSNMEVTTTARLNTRQISELIRTNVDLNVYAIARSMVITSAGRDFYIASLNHNIPRGHNDMRAGWFMHAPWRNPQNEYFLIEGSGVSELTARANLLSALLALE